VLTDDRASFPTPFPAGAVLNPNSGQSFTFPVNTGASTSMTVVRLASSGTLLTIGNVGDPYYVEWPATPATGTVGADYIPTNEGIKFSFAAGSIPFVNGDEFIVTVFAEVDDLLLPADQVPILQSINLLVTPRTAL